jgi:hypothetical protein
LVEPGQRPVVKSPVQSGLDCVAGGLRGFDDPLAAVEAVDQQGVDLAVVGVFRGERLQFLGYFAVVPDGYLGSARPIRAISCRSLSLMISASAKGRPAASGKGHRARG